MKKLKLTIKIPKPKIRIPIANKPNKRHRSKRDYNRKVEKSIPREE